MTLGVEEEPEQLEDTNHVMIISSPIYEGTGSSSNELTEGDDVVEVSSCNETESDGVHTIETSTESIEEDDVIEATSDAIEVESNGVHAVENNGTNMENTMNVEEKVQEPEVGMIFDNADQVATYYKEYGRQSGFPMIKRSSTKGDDGKLRYITMCCARSGTSKNNSSNPIFPHTNENMALLLGLSQAGHPNPLYKESGIGNISYPTMHGNYVQGQQYPYWNGGYSMYNMHSSTSRGNDDQELN